MGGVPFPHVCRLCWLNSDIISTTVSIYYVITITCSGMMSVLLHVALLTSLHMRGHAYRHILEGGALKGTGGSYPLGVVPLVGSC